MSDCGARLVGDQELVCNRNSHHYTKDHRAVGSWVTSNGRLVTGKVSWSVGADEWGKADSEFATHACCGYVDHSSGYCVCPSHPSSYLHPLGIRPWPAP